jgi:hypothetical protein
MRSSLNRGEEHVGVRQELVKCHHCPVRVNQRHLPHVEHRLAPRAKGGAVQDDMIRCLVPFKIATPSAGDVSHRRTDDKWAKIDAARSEKGRKRRNAQAATDAAAALEAVDKLSS